MSRKRILVVEDNEDLLHGLLIRLKANGYETLAARDGVQATALARREDPDLVILDLRLPAGDGFLLMKRWRSLSTFNAPIIVLTARDAASSKAQALEAGAVAFFQKPVENRSLLAAIGLALGGGEARRLATV